MATETQKQQLLRDLCRHVVCLSGAAIQLDQHGRRVGQPIYYNVSGFVVSLFDNWFWVTAGHALHDIEKQIDTKQVELLSCGLSGYYSQNVNVAMSIPFDYPHHERYSIDDDAEGRDIAIVPLHAYYRDRLTECGVIDFRQEFWSQRPDFRFDDYGILGFPNEHLVTHTHTLPSGVTVQGGARPVLLMARLANATPKYRVAPRTPWIALDLKDRANLQSIKGMSGGPILAFQNEPENPLRYVAVGVQSFWEKDRDIAFGTSLGPVMEEAIGYLITAAKTDEARDRG